MKTASAYTDGAPEIHVLDQKVRLLQPVDGFRTSLDSVMLAGACRAQAVETVLDLGCGVGGAGLCVLYRCSGAHLTGIDIQAGHIELATQNAVLNGMEKRTSFLCADVVEFEAPKRFDHVICNPPYLEAGAHQPSPRPSRALAHGHKELAIEDWIDAAFRLLKSRGCLTLIHRADMSDRILQSLGRRFGAVEIIPLWPRTDAPARRVIVRAVKDRKSPLTLHPGLVLHDADGRYTPEAERVLRGGASLP